MNKGIVYILIATAAFSVMNAMVKELNDLHPMQVVFLRAFGTFAIIFPLMLIHKVSIIGDHPKWLLLRAVVGTVSLATFFIALQRIPLGSAIAIRYTAPIFAALLAWLWLKEHIKPGQWVSFGIAFVGVVVLKGFDLRIDTMSLILLVVSAILVGGVFVLIRFLSSREHIYTIINYFMVTSMLLGLAYWPQWSMPQGTEWWSAAGIGFFGFIGQIFMTKAYVHEETSVIAPFKYMELVWALLAGYLWFGESYGWWPMVGLVLILLGMLGNVWVKKRRAAQGATGVR